MHSGVETVKYVDKPWGWEFHLWEWEGWRVKILHVEAGHRTSRQYHAEKIEYMFYPDGRHVFIPTKQIHRLEGPVEVLEVSKGSDADIVRVDDDYGRRDHG